MKKRKAALELSIGTIVILVLAMSMLILGIVLIKTIFSGAKYNVETINEKVRTEINKLFSEGKRSVIYLPDLKAKMKLGESYGVAFAIQNSGKTQQFSWTVTVDTDPADLRRNCGISEKSAESFIVAGRTGKAATPSGQTHYEVIRFNIPENAVTDISSCVIRYRINIYKEGKEIYDAPSFDVMFTSGLF